MDDSRLVAIGSFASHMDAQIAKAHLESEGIPSTVKKDDGGGAFPSMTGLAGGASLVVSEENAERAREILDAAD